VLQCVECGIQLSDAGDHKAICGRGRVCYVCSEMFGLVYNRTWWIEAQGEWLAEQKHKRKLMPGSEYLE
jgi:hypothetical protein